MVGLRENIAVLRGGRRHFPDDDEMRRDRGKKLEDKRVAMAMCIIGVAVSMDQELLILTVPAGKSQEIGFCVSAKVQKRRSQKR